MTLAMMVMMVILMRMMTKMTKKYKCNWFLVNSYQFWGLLKKGQKFGQWPPPPPLLTNARKNFFLHDLFPNG